MIFRDITLERLAQNWVFKGVLKKRITQEQIIFIITLICLVLFSVFIKGFASIGNILILLRNISVLGIFSIGMGLVVLGRGIDLSMVTTGVVSTAWVLNLMQGGTNLGLILLSGLFLVLLMGVINGSLISFIEIPPLFATLASGLCIYGFVRHFLLHLLNNLYVPASYSAFLFLGQGIIAGIPAPIIWFGLLALCVHIFLTRTSFGDFIYTIGDNEKAARFTGIGVRPLKILQYIICAFIGYLASLVMASSIGSIDVRIVDSGFIFDVVLIVVLGGISLKGGRGGVASIIAGTLLIGTLINGMLLLDLGIVQQDIVKSLILLGAIILDTLLHPRDEETARQGDI